MGGDVGTASPLCVHAHRSTNRSTVRTVHDHCSVANWSIDRIDINCNA